MAELRALLLTDVVDSTRLAQQLGDEAMARVWLAHDRAARDLLPAWRGREIDKTDGMLMLFDTAADAVGYALAYHRALAALPLPLEARAGLHVGAVLLRENSAEDIARGAKPLEVEGLAKPTAARVMALARGGQTLLTPEAREDLGRTVLKVRAHGHWMVKGVTEPVEIFEVGDEDTRLAAPGDSEKAWRVVRQGDWWMPVADIPNNLPQQGTSFVGREREVDEIRTLLAGARMLTLVGPGGVGKTRLALQVAADELHRYPDGVWFLDLAPVRDPVLVLGEAARVLGLSEEPDRPLLQTLCAALRSRRVLFILDNCEHLIESSAGLAFAIIQAAPQVHLIASSREGLHIPAERTFPVAPLPLPRAGAAPAELERSAAVQLFVERARQHKPSFVLDAREAAAVAELVTRLEGLPLAIELAAARVRALAVADINARLKDRYKLLTTGARGVQARQQTLRAAVDWSYDLLAPAEQALFDRLGVFAGGFDLAAAEGVCGTEALDPADVLDLLASLVEKSLVVLEADAARVGRYRMLETLRDYARERLAVAGRAGPTAARHCGHFLAFAKEAGHGLHGPQPGAWIARLEDELDNLRAAMDWASSPDGDPVLLVKYCVALLGFWTLRGYASEGRGIVRTALALPAVQASDIAHAWALYVGAGLADAQSDHAQAREMLEACLALRRRLDSPRDTAATLSTLALTLLHGGNAEGARERETEAIGIFRSLGDRYGEAIGLLHLGQVAAALGDDALAQRHLDDGLAIARRIGNVEVAAECERELGALALFEGDLPTAQSRLQHALGVCREANDSRGETQVGWWLGRTDLAAGDLPSARERLGKALRAFHGFEMWDELLACVEDHARLVHAEGRSELGLGLVAAAARARERLGLPRARRDVQLLEPALRAMRNAMSDAAQHAAWAAGRAWDIDDAIGCAV
jgi:predicted ATPase/class 3 adenylate cyclase